jgi:cysteine desulfurase / selenocysteine lyase
MYDINKVRQDFPILSRTVYDKPLVYLDNAATTQKPLCVLDAMRDEYLNVNANVHRGVHYLSQQATDLHEAARETVRKFINAPKIEEIIFTRGTTESLNLVVSSFCEQMSEFIEVNLTFIINRNNTDGNSLLCSLQLPRHDIGMVLHCRNNHLIALAHKLITER